MGLGSEKENLWTRRSSFNDASTILNGQLQSRLYVIIWRIRSKLLQPSNGARRAHALTSQLL